MACKTSIFSVPSMEIKKTRGLWATSLTLETVPINKLMNANYDYTMTLRIRKKKIVISFMTIECYFNCSVQT